jgi:hypothetical protein
MIPGTRYGIEMTGPTGTYCLVAIAVASELRSPLLGLARESYTRSLPDEELDSLLKQIEALDTARRWVSFCEYDVCPR